jgi:hypothetical protein
MRLPPITCQKLRCALERIEKLVQKWLQREYPHIKALARRKCRDAAHVRSDHHSDRTWGKKGETPIVESTGARYGMSLISAVTSRGHMRFMIKEKGGVNAEELLKFAGLDPLVDVDELFPDAVRPYHPRPLHTKGRVKVGRPKIYPKDSPTVAGIGNPMGMNLLRYWYALTKQANITEDG